MLKLVGGALALVFGAAILIWVTYNLLIERQPEAKGSPLPAIGFSIVLLVVGGKWALDGWQTVQENRRPKKRRKKRKRLVREDDE